MNSWFAQERRARRLRIAPRRDGYPATIRRAFGADGFSVERFAISYLPAGRDLSVQERRTPALGEPVIAPGAGRKRRAARARQCNRKRVSRRASGEIGRRGSGSSQFAGAHSACPALLAEGEATEQNLKELSQPGFVAHPGTWDRAWQ